jgi:hypothetical protein
MKLQVSSCLIHFLVICFLLILSIPLPAVPEPQTLIPTLFPLREGVVFFCPNDNASAISQLEQIRAQGFNLIEFASWAWTLPKAGSQFQKRVSAVLDWCDQNSMAFFLLQNIQYDDQGEGGGLDDQVQTPEKSFPLITDWANILRGHRCVKGVILGNEVSPTLGDPKTSPLMWSQFRTWLKDKYGSITNLNAHWGAVFSSFQDVTEPIPSSPGRLDYDRYAILRFSGFYDALVGKVLKPSMGNLLYGNKTSLDPFLHRACKAMTVCCWDDLNSQFPLWQIKLAADTTGKPLFNSELHLYDDNYNYGPSIQQSRYRYFASALLGEYTTASFAWGQWNKPDIQRIAAATPGILADLRREQGACRTLARAYQTAGIMVLVTQRTYIDEMAGTGKSILENLYARMGALGEPWRYLLEEDIPHVKKGVLIVPTDYLSLKDAREIMRLPSNVRLYYLSGAPHQDEYLQSLPAAVVRRLQKRGGTISMERLIPLLAHRSTLPSAFRNVGNVSYLGWDPKRGFYEYPVPYCLAQVFQAGTKTGRVLAVVNNSGGNITAPAPWSAKEKVTDILTGVTPHLGMRRSLLLTPFSVLLFQVVDTEKPGLPSVF